MVHLCRKFAVISCKNFNEPKMRLFYPDSLKIILENTEFSINSGKRQKSQYFDKPARLKKAEWQTCFTRRRVRLTRTQPFLKKIVSKKKFQNFTSFFMPLCLTFVETFA